MSDSPTYDVNTGTHDQRPMPDVTGWSPERAYIRGHMHGHQDGTRSGAVAERTRIIAIIKRRCAAYEAQDDGHGALLIVGFGFLLTDIEGEETT